MRDLVLGWLPWGLEALLALQARAVPTADLLWTAITHLGDELAYLGFFAVFYWSEHKRSAVRLAVLYLASAYSNALLKQLLRIPRPFVISPDIQAKVTASGYAFPSGHAQSAATFWPALYLSLPKPWLGWLALLLVPLIAFSRLYLGVHYPQDAVAGILVGLLWVGLFAGWGASIEAWLARRGRRARLGLALLIPLALAVALPARDALSAAGALAGLGLGHALQEQHLAFRARPDARAGRLRALLGLTLVAVAYMALTGAMPSHGAPILIAIVRLLRYLVVGVVVTLLAPYLFTRLGLAERTAAVARSRAATEA